MDENIETVATMSFIGILMLGIGMWFGSYCTTNWWHAEIRERGHADWVLNQKTLKVEFIWNNVIGENE